MTRYSGGADFERETRKHLEVDGYDVIRSAGSKGKVDLIAWKPTQILLVQCKRNGTCPPAERRELIRLANRMPGWAHPVIASRPRVTFRVLTGPGPKDWDPFFTDEAGR
jgi:Holliday junction resolvase